MPDTDGVLKSLTRPDAQLNLKDVEVDFDKYNFIITLNGLVIDTTNFAQAYHRKTVIEGGYNPQKEKKGWLVLTSSTKDIKTQNDFVEDEARVIIFEETVKDIKVKSTRDFLKNQTTKK